MGYTNYWHRKKDFTNDQWENIRKDVSIILKHCENQIQLAEEYDAPGKKPLVNATTIRFNGVREEGHETFIMSRKKPEPRPWESEESFDFCKTARKAYDLPVGLTLLACVRHAPDAIRIGSDGDWDKEWTETRRVFKELFGIDAPCPFDLVEN